MKINVFIFLISIAFSAQALDQLPAELFDQIVKHLVEPLTMRNAFSLFSLEQSSKSLSMQTSVVCQKLLLDNQKASQFLSYAARACSARALTLVLCNVKPVLESKAVGTIINQARQLPIHDDKNKCYIQLDEQASCRLFKIVGFFYPYALYDAENPHLVAKTPLTIIKLLESGNIFPQVMIDGKLFWKRDIVPTLHHLIEHTAIENGAMQPFPYAAIEMLLKHGANPSYKFNGFDAFDRLKKNAKRSHAEKEQLKELLLGYKRGPVIDTTNIMYPEKN